MLALRLQPGSSSARSSGGEINATVYSRDGSLVLSGGWDGRLRQWNPAADSEVASFKAADKPVSACAVTPDGDAWLVGSLDGMLARWDAVAHERRSVFLAHNRPIAAIVFSPDEQTFATASWDRQVILWELNSERAGRPLAGHRDIVSGCRFTPDGQVLVTWSYDGTLRFWDVARARSIRDLAAHAERVTAGDVSPNGQLAATGARDGGLRLWDVQSGEPGERTDREAELRCCFFLLDGESLVTVDAKGRVVLHALPSLEVLAELETGWSVQCGALAPGGGQLSLGCGDGVVRFVAIDGTEEAPLLVKVSLTERHTANAFQRMLGRSRVVSAFSCKCPVCRRQFELPHGAPGQPAPCPHCRRKLRVSTVAFARQAV